MRGFHGDTIGIDGLAEWYEQHVEAWSGWRARHDAVVLEHGGGLGDRAPAAGANGWEYVQAITWDKGIAHIAGNVNGKTIRRFPVVTEICVFYQRRFEVPVRTGRCPCSGGCGTSGSGQDCR